MIRNVSTSSPWLTLNSWPGSTPSFNASAPMSGMLRWDPGTSSMYVYDGSTWLSIGNGGATVDVSPETDMLLRWAREKKAEEDALKVRMEKHPGLKDAYEKFRIMDALTLEQEKEDK